MPYRDQTTGPRHAPRGHKIQAISSIGVRELGHDALKLQSACSRIQIRAILEVLAVDNARRFLDKGFQHPLSLNQRGSARVIFYLVFGQLRGRVGGMSLLSRIFVVVLCTAVGHGIVFAFGLDKKVAAVISLITQTKISPDAMWALTWSIAGVIGLIGLGLWELRHPLFARIQQRISIPGQSHASSAALPPQRDVWLYDAICRIFLGRWERIPIKDGRLDLSANGFQAIHDLIEHIRQLAFDGRIPIWGKTQGYTALWEKSAPAFWKDNQIHYLSFTDGDPEKLCAVPRDTGGQIISLRELMTNRGMIDALCQTPSVAASLPTNDANSLRILTGTENPFDKIEVNEYGVHHTISIGVTNTGSKQISNCKFYRTYIAFTNDHQKALLDGPFSLEPNERRYVSIAIFNETKDLPHANHLIGLSMPPGTFGAGIMQPQLPPDRRHVVSFVAESPDSKDAEFHCELSVDKRGKLHLESL